MLVRVSVGFMFLFFLTGCITVENINPSPDVSGPPSDVSELSPDVSTSQPSEGASLSWEMPTDITFTCGESAGMHVVIENESGDREVCDADWVDGVDIDSPVTGEGDHLLADCFLFQGQGNWRITEMWPYNTDGEPMDCCDVEYPEVVLTAEQTNEYYSRISCDLPNGGALDLTGWLDLGPVIIDVDITPNKFTPTCREVTITVDAVSYDNDTVYYSWEVLEEPENAQYSLTPSGDGHIAVFQSWTLGDYKLLLTVYEELGLSQILTFPIHVTNESEDCCYEDCCP